MSCEAISIEYALNYSLFSRWSTNPLTWYDLVFNKTFEDDNIIIYSGFTSYDIELAKGRFLPLYDESIVRPAVCSPSYSSPGIWSFTGHIIVNKKISILGVLYYNTKVDWTCSNHGDTINTTFYYYSSLNCIEHPGGCNAVFLRIKNNCVDGTDIELPKKDCNLCHKCDNKIMLDCNNKCSNELTWPDNISLDFTVSDLNLPVRLGTYPIFWVDTPTGVNMYNGTYVLQKSNFPRTIPNSVFSAPAPNYFGNFTFGKIGSYDLYIGFLLYFRFNFTNDDNSYCPFVCQATLYVTFAHPGIINSYYRRPITWRPPIIDPSYSHIFGNIFGQEINLNQSNLLYNIGYTLYNNLSKPVCNITLTPV